MKRTSRVTYTSFPIQTYQNIEGERKIGKDCEMKTYKRQGIRKMRIKKEERKS
jgi:hypothetical protein